MTRSLDDCFLHDKDRITHGEALALLRARLRPVAQALSCPLMDAGGRLIAETVTAPRPIPAHTNAAVDGYAFCWADYDPDEGAYLLVKGRAAAGHPIDAVAPGTAARIFTGAQMPDGSDSVVMQEDVALGSEGKKTWVQIPPGLKRGANCRLAGEDVPAGAVMLEPGARLRPQDVAAIASTGLGEIRCFAPLRVAVFSTGDEIVRAGRALGQGQVFDANAPMLKALLDELGASVTDLGVLADEYDAVATQLSAAARDHDVLLTSGGASRGDEDHVVSAIDRLGKLHMWQIAVKPGRPMAFGQLGDCLFFGLPGNPVAVFVCYLLYVRPALTVLGGGSWPEPSRYHVPARFDIAKKKADRREFLRAALHMDADGRLSVDKYPSDGSGLISSLRAADGLVELDEAVTSVARGDPVAFIPFAEFGLLRE